MLGSCRVTKLQEVAALQDTASQLQARLSEEMRARAVAREEVRRFVFFRSSCKGDKCSGELAATLCPWMMECDNALMHGSALWGKVL